MENREKRQSSWGERSQKFGKRRKSRAAGKEELTPQQKMKLEIAEELGLMEKLQRGGFSCLTARETGKIGGLMNARIRAARMEGISSDSCEKSDREQENGQN